MWPGRSHTEEKSQELESCLVLVKANSPAMTLEESCDGS